MLTITDKEFRQLAGFIQANYGIHLKEEKKALVIGRLQQVLIKMNLKSFSEYYDYLARDKTGESAATLVDRMTTNHTFFMREPDHFHFFRDTILPYLHQSVKEKDLRIWSAACSSGEEPYTLAMYLDDYFGHEKASWDARILATDISAAMLDAAKAAVYSNDRIAELPLKWKKQYFQPFDAERSILKENIRSQLIFRKFNLMETTLPFKKKFHIIFCRNVMIYFDSKTKEDLVERLYHALEYGGYLFIGQSESINRETTRFRYIMPAVYRKV
jgi:chemotaxis protein methyltransferase CheR